MKRALPFSLLPVLGLVLLACGKDSPEGAAGGAEDAASRSWEWYSRAGDRIESLEGEVVDPSGQPVSGARVTVMLMPRAMFTPFLRAESTTTDAAGKFTLAGVPVSAFLMAEKPGLAGRVLRAMTHVFEAGRPTRIALGPGTEVTGIAKYADGRALADYTVWGMTQFGDWFGLTRTDAEGRFRLVDVPVTSIFVVAAPGRVRGRSPDFQVEPGNPREVFVTVQEVPVVAGQVIEEGTGVPIPGAVVHTRVQEEEAVRTDAEGRFRLEGVHTGVVAAYADGFGEVVVSLPSDRKETEDVYIRLSPAARVRGRVVDPSGRGVAGARVMSSRQGSDGVVVSRGPFTRDDGSFDYTWLPVPPEGARITLYAEHPDLAPGWSEDIPLLRGQEVAGTTLRLGAYGSLRLRLLDEKGEPWVQADARLQRRDEDPLEARAPQHVQEPFSVSDLAGMVHVSGLRPGAWLLRVTIPERLPFTLPFTVEDGQTVALGEQVVPRGLVLAGRVVNAEGRPFPEARLEVTRQGEPESWPLPVGDDGSFRMQGFAEGEHVLVAMAPDHETVRLPVKAGTEGIEVRVLPYGSLSITVAARPEEPCHVEAERVDGPPTERLTTPVDLEAGVSKTELKSMVRGRYRIRAWCGDLFGATFAQVGVAAATAVEIALAPGGSLTGRAVDPQGNPVERVGVEIDLGEDYGRRIEWTNSDGVFRIRALPEGRWTLVVRPERRPEVSVGVEVRVGAEVTANLVLHPGARIRVRALLQESGAPAAGVSARLTAETGQPATYWVEGDGKPETSSQGTLTLTGIAPGTYTLHLSYAGGMLERRRVRIEPDRDLEVPVSVPK